MDTTSVEYKCPACGGVLAFSAEEGQMVCSSCDNKYTVEAATAFNKAETGSKTFDWGEFKINVDDENLSDAVSYICQSCGAEIEAVGTTIATHCPYCDNEVVINEKASDILKPNGIIPFKIAKNDLKGCLQKFYAKRKLLPNNFISDSKIRDVQGVYVPFWLYNCGINGEVMMNAEKSTSHRSGDYIVTNHYHYLLERGGEMEFANIPADASIKMDNALMDSLEPFNYEDVVPYDSAYLSGFLADRFDTTPESEEERATKRMESSLLKVLTNDAPGYSNVSIRSNNMSVSNPDIQYVLLPVYLLNTEYEGKKYQLAVNGQTGKVVGEVPIDKKKKALRFWLGFGIGLAALTPIILLFLNWLYS